MTLSKEGAALKEILDNLEKEFAWINKPATPETLNYSEKTLKMPTTPSRKVMQQKINFD